MLPCALASEFASRVCPFHKGAVESQVERTLCPSNLILPQPFGQVNPYLCGTVAQSMHSCDAHLPSRLPAAGVTACPTLGPAAQGT